MSSKVPAHFKNKGDLTNGDVKSHLIRLSVPMMWGIGAIISFQLVDMFFIAQLGTQELAAVTFTFPLTFAIFSITMGFGIAMSSVASRLIGAGQNEDVRRVTTHGTFFMFLLGIVISGVGILLLEPIFKLQGAPESLMPIIRDYMLWWFLGGIFITIPMVTNAAMRAQGDTITPAIIMTVVAVVNTVLDPLLIFGLWGFPRLEVQGAAIATVIANAAAMITGLYVLYVKKKLLCHKQLMRLNLFWDSIKRLLFIALPVGLTNAIQPFINAIIISLLTQTSVEAVAAYGIVSRIEAFAFIIVMGVAVGMAPIIGQNHGAGKMERVNDTLRIAIRFAMFYSLFVAGILILFAEPIAQMFRNDPLVIQYAVLFFMIVPITYAFSNLVSGWASAFNAMGMPHYSLMMIVVKMLLLMIPAIYIGHAYYGVTGLFMAIAIVNVIAGLTFHLWARKMLRKQMNTATK